MARPEIPGVRLGRVISRDGFGLVLQGRQLTMDRPVVVRILRPDAESGSRARFLERARILGGLNHPNLARVLSAGESAGALYCVTEQIEGIPLSVHLRNHGRVPESEALEITRECAKALAALHAGGLRYGGFSEERIVLAFDGSVRLAGPDPCSELEGDPSADLRALGQLAIRMVAGPPESRGRVPAGVAGLVHALEAGTLTAAGFARELDRMIAAGPPAPTRRPPVPPAATQKVPQAALLAGVTAGVALLVALVALVTSRSGSPQVPPARNTDSIEPEPPPPTPGPPEKPPAPPSGPPPQDSFEKRIAQIRERADWLWSNDSPLRLTEPYDEFQREIEKSRGTPLEAKWVGALAAFLAEQEDRIEPIWARVREEALVRERTGDPAAALALLQKFPDELCWFRKNPPHATRAGEERDRLRAKMENRVREKNREDLRTLLELAGAGKFEEAWGKLGSFGEVREEAVAKELAGMPERLVRSEFDRLTGDGLDAAVVERVRARMEAIATAHPAVADLARSLAAEAEARLRRRLEELALRVATGFAAEIRPKVRELLVARDTAAARKTLAAFLSDPEFRPVLGARDTAELAADRVSNPVTLRERLTDELLAAGNVVLREALWVSRAAVLLEWLYGLALTGLEAGAKDPEVLKNAKTELLRSARPLAIAALDPEPGRMFAARVRGKILTIAPTGEIPMDATDVVTFARLAVQGEPDAWFELAAAIHFELAGRIREAARALEKVQGERPAAGIEEFRKRIEEALAALPPEPEPPPPEPGPVEPQFAGKVKKHRDGTIEVEYDFSKEEQLGDFESVRSWLGGNLDARFEGAGRVRLEGSGGFLWKHELEGDVAIEVRLTAGGQSFGILIHGQGTNRGYLAIFDWEWGGGRGGGMFNDRALLTKLPINWRSPQNSRLDQKGGAQVRDGASGTLWGTRQGNQVSAGFGNAQVQGEDGDFSRGRLGLFLSRTTLTVHSIKVRGKLAK